MNEQLLSPVQDARTNPTLEFRDGQMLFRMATLAGTTVERLVSWEALREAATGIPVDSGWLGPEIVRWGNSKHGGEWVVAFIPPGRRELELTVGIPGPEEQVERVTAPLPGMVMFGGGVKYFVWAVQTERFDPFGELYRPPLPNVLQDASVCWGLLKPPQASPRSIMKAWELFITSTFNNHAANGKSKSHREDVRGLLKELAGREIQPWSDEMVYPVDDLIRQVEGGVTAVKAVQGFFETGMMPG